MRLLAQVFPAGSRVYYEVPRVRYDVLILGRMMTVHRYLSIEDLCGEYLLAIDGIRGQMMVVISILH